MTAQKIRKKEGTQTRNKHNVAAWATFT